jgi:hypothetical protein
MWFAKGAHILAVDQDISEQGNAGENQQGFFDFNSLRKVYFLASAGMRLALAVLR